MPGDLIGREGGRIGGKEGLAGRPSNCLKWAYSLCYDNCHYDLSNYDP